MARKKSDNPTDGELEILQVLWDRGASSAGDVQQALGGATGYTTVLKLLQIMLEKGIVTRDDSRRPHLYEASDTRKRTRSKFVTSMARKLFGGSTADLAMHALSEENITPGELQEIRDLIDQLEKKAK
ncbi:MAG: BlaI/MecI/CopY family transcriptional regulator [Verrucomicrobiales bacterium]|nr:BlaI/MecI/CopY family transcriptional regulator [Verrucomicrobiales bacterium]